MDRGGSHGSTPWHLSAGERRPRDRRAIRTDSGHVGMELAKNLRIDSVSRLNPTASLQISPSSSVAEAVALLRNHKVGCILVCIAEEVVGIFTERDLMRRVLAANLPFSLPVSQ